LLPPLAEQVEIVAEVEIGLSQIDAAEAAVAHSLQRATRLRQSILKQAFEGKLVPQDPADEPASVLLERLRADREKALAEDTTNGAATRRIKKRRSAPTELPTDA